MVCAGLLPEWSKAVESANMAEAAGRPEGGPAYFLGVPRPGATRRTLRGHRRRAGALPGGQHTVDHAVLPRCWMALPLGSWVSALEAAASLVGYGGRETRTFFKRVKNRWYACAKVPR